MSGHSKWHSIKFKKGITDARRGKTFSKLARMITVAARGGGDPEMNFKLRLAMDKAKQVNMPKDNIDRAVKKGTGELKGEALEQISYEGYGPEGTALIIEVLTDNRNRASSDVRSILTKYGGRMGETGSVKWMFDQRGVITVDTKSLSEDKKEEIELSAIDAGAQDIKTDSEVTEIYTKPEELHKIKEKLEQNSIQILSAEILLIPKNTVKIEDEEKAKKVLKLMDALDESEDIADVYSNFDIKDEILNKEV